MAEAGGLRQSARERILDTAFRLFYAYGLHGVGVDTVIAESGVAPRPRSLQALPAQG